MFTIKKLPKNLSKPLKLLKNKYPKTCSTLSRWQAGEFHFGSACLSIYLKLSNSNYIFQTIAENKDTYIHTSILELPLSAKRQD